MTPADSAPSTPAEAMAEYAARSRAHDLDAMLELVDDDAVYWFSNESAHVGKLAVGQAVRANFDSIVGDTYATYDLRWLVETPDVAVCVYGFRWSGRIGGQEASGAGRGTSVLARREGRWVVVHEHLSRGVPNG